MNHAELLPDILVPEQLVAPDMNRALLQAVQQFREVNPTGYTVGSSVLAESIIGAPDESVQFQLFAYNNAVYIQKPGHHQKSVNVELPHDAQPPHLFQPGIYGDYGIPVARDGIVRRNPLRDLTYPEIANLIMDLVVATRRPEVLPTVINPRQYNS